MQRGGVTGIIDFQNGSVFKLKQNDEYASICSNLLIDDEKILGSTRQFVTELFLQTSELLQSMFRASLERRRTSPLFHKKYRGFSIETAGTFDLDSELELYFSGLGKVKFEFTGQTNILHLAKVIASFALSR